MNRLFSKIKQGAFSLGVMALTGGLILTMNAPASAQTGANIRVLVMGEDSDPASVKRSSDIYKRVLAEMKGSMMRYNFKMVDEEMAAVDLGWNVTDRRPKVELLEAVKLMNASPNATHHARAMVLFRIHATTRDLSFSNKVTTRIDGEIYDMATNQFLDTFELAPGAYAAPADCNKICITEVVGERAREIAMSLGDILGKKLSYLSPSDTANNTGDDNGYGMVTTYTVTLRHFDTREGLSVIGVMADEFPGYISHNLMTKQSALRRYEYVTKAKPYKMEEWLTILLMDMGFDVDNQVNISVENGLIIIDKIIPVTDRPRSNDEETRFN